MENKKKFQFTQFEYSSDDESDSSSPSSHNIFVNLQNDPDLAYFLDGDCIIREETLKPTQEETQDEDDGFYQPQPEDEYMGEQV